VPGLGPSPDPGPGAGIEPGGGDPGGAGDLAGAGEVLPGQRPAPEDPPPGLLEAGPAGALGDEGVPDAGRVFQPGPVALLSWLDRLSATTQTVPPGLASSARCRNRW
jgi:hypothetical protein